MKYLLITSGKLDCGKVIYMLTITNMKINTNNNQLFTNQNNQEDGTLDEIEPKVYQ